MSSAVLIIAIIITLLIAFFLKSPFLFAVFVVFIAVNSLFTDFVDKKNK